MAGRGRWQNGIPLGQGVSTTSGGNLGFEPGHGVLVSPTREERAREERAANNGGMSGNSGNVGGSNGLGRNGGGSGGLLPKFSPVNDNSFGKKSLYWSPK